MQTRYSEENSVRPSVLPSVCHTRDPWQNGREVCPYFYTIRKNIYPSFLRRRIVGGGRPLLPEILGHRPPWTEIADFQPIIARSFSAITPSERGSINANRKSTTRFSMSLRWSSYVAPKSPKEGLSLSFEGREGKWKGRREREGRVWTSWLSNLACNASAESIYSYRF